MAILGSVPCRALVLGLCLIGLSACDGITPEEHLQNAQRYYGQADYPTAVIELKNALQKNPDLAEARYLLAEAYASQGQYTDAVREYERALDLGIDHDALQSGLLNAKNRVGRFQEVLGELENREALSPALAVVLADAYLAAQDTANARRLYGAHPGLAAANRGMGTIAWLEADLDAARRLLDLAVSQDPSSRESWVRKGEFALAHGDLTTAETAFGEARDLPGGSLSGGLGLARTYLAQGRFDEAVIEAEAVLDGAPGFYLAHYVAALAKYALDDVEGAEAALRQVQRVAPEHTPSLYLMGAVKFRQGQLNQAEGSLLRFLARERDNESASKLLALIRLQREDLAGVTETLRPFVETTEDSQLLALLGSAQLQLGQVNEATRALQRAVELAPDTAVFRNQLALSLLSAGEDERAALELETAIAVDGAQFQSDYLMAMLNLKQQKFSEGARAARQMIEKSPEQPIGYNLLGAARLGEGDEAAARRAFEQALDAAPDFLPAAENLARLDEAAGDAASAEARYRAVLEQAPGSIEARLALADLAARQGDLAGAGRMLEEVLSIDPDALRARLGLARVALRQGDLGNARVQVDAGLRLAPELPDALLLAADLALRQGNQADAARRLDAIQRLIDQGRQSPELLLATTRLQRRAGLTQDARDNLNRLAGSRGGLPDGVTDPEVRFERLRLELATGDAAAARRLLTPPVAAGQAPEDLPILEAQLLQLEGRTDEAVAAYAAEAGAGNRDALVRLVALQLGRGEHRAALDLLDQWLGAHESDVGLALLRADTLMRLSERNQAVAQYEALLATDNPVVLNNLAWLYMEDGDERAVALAERAVSLAPERGDIADTLGWILIRFGEPQRAIAHIQQSLAQRPEDATLHYHLGVAFLESGRSEEGRRALEQALRLGPFAEQEDAERRLSTLGEV